MCEGVFVQILFIVGDCIVIISSKCMGGPQICNYYETD